MINFMIKRMVFDLETPKGYFLYCGKDLGDGKKHQFSINQYQNDLYKLTSHLSESLDYHFVGYNNLTFDNQVIEWIWRNYTKWFDKSGIEIAALISEFASNVIGDTNGGGFPPYREDELTFKAIDVFKIQHFDNKNRRVGLKRVEYEMDMEEIEGMPVPVDKKEFTIEECKQLVHYCWNDVESTYKNYLYITGQTDNIIYKGTNEIEIRAALSEKFGFNAMNYSNSKYGDEIIKTLYCKEAGIEYSQLPRKGTFRKSIKLKNCIPKHIKFKTKQLKEFLEDVRVRELQASEEFMLNVVFDGQKYTFAKGGLHNVIKNKQYHSEGGLIIKDVDVTSYYVATILNNKLAPAHLDQKAFTKAYEWIYNERVKLKPLSKTDSTIRGIVAGYKEAGVSVYGKSGDESNWLLDKQMMLTTCIAGQFSILMLIEAQSLIGNKCIMANTDGATFMIDENRIAQFDAVCEQWKKDTNYKLEFFDFDFLYFRDVNNYIGKYVEGYNDPIMGNVKRKGIFATDTHLHKNKRFRIISLALYEYFVNNKDVDEYINTFDNIFHFGGRVTAGSNYEIVTYEGTTRKILPKLIRYYVSKEGIHIKKEVKEGVLTNANDNSVTPAEKRKIVCNSLLKETHQEHLQRIDREWYIDEVKQIIFQIERGRVAKRTDMNKDQLTLF